MKSELTIQELAQQIEARAGLKNDYVVPTNLIEVAEDGNHITVGDATFSIGKIAHEQIGEHAGIPRAYYKRLQEEAPDLLGANIKRWFEKYPTRRLVRTLGDNARAFLSDKYGRFDDDGFANTVLPVIADQKGAKVVSCAITEERTHIKFVSEQITRDVKVNDPVQFGIAFSNSEVGRGRLQASLLTYRLICLNGAVIPDEGWGRSHVGERIGKGISEEIFQLDTVAADAKATLLKLRDFAKELLSERRIDAVVAKIKGLAEVEVKNPVVAVEKLGRAHGFTETEQGSILSHLIKGGDLSLWGLQNAVTAAAQDKELTYTRAHEFETIGGKLLDLSRPEYKEILQAA